MWGGQGKRSGRAKLSQAMEDGKTQIDKEGCQAHASQGKQQEETCEAHVNMVGSKVGTCF